MKSKNKKVRPSPALVAASEAFPTASETLRASYKARTDPKAAHQLLYSCSKYCLIHNYNLITNKVTIYQATKD